MQKPQPGDDNDESATKDKDESKGFSGIKSVLKSCLPTRKRAVDEEKRDGKPQEPKQNANLKEESETLAKSDITQKADFDNATHDLHDMVRH